MSYGYNARGSGNGGYGNSDFEEEHVSHVLSPDTIRSAIRNAAQKGQLSQAEADSIKVSDKEYNEKVRNADRNPCTKSCCTGGRRSAGPGESHYRGSDMTPPSSSHSNSKRNFEHVRYDANGDQVREFAGEDDEFNEMPLGIHRPPSPEEMQAPARRGTGSPRESGSRRQSEQQDRQELASAARRPSQQQSSSRNGSYQSGSREARP